MDYTKYILQREGIELGKSQTFVDIYETLSNQRDIQKVGKQILGTLKLKGAVSLIRYQDNRFHIVETKGSSELAQKAFEDKTVLKEIRSSKKMYESKENPLTKPYYIALPILSKEEEFLGALVIHELQEVKCWKDIVVALHFMSFVYKYYELIEFNKNFALIDSVTYLNNFRHFQNLLELEIDKAARYNMPFSMVMIDIENFKMINEKLGSNLGDEVLRQLAKWIQSSVRKVDMPARLEADTFAILLTNTPVEGAHVMLDRLLIKIKNNTVKVGDKEFKLRVKSTAVAFENHLSAQEFIDKGFDSLTVEE